MHLRYLSISASGALIALALPATGAATTFNPVTPSQSVECNQVDKSLAQLPHGDGVAPVTESETGPGGWRFSSGGGSFVTFAHDLNLAGDGYDVDAGRSNVGANSGIINDYPGTLDLPQSDQDGVLSFKGRHGVITLTGDSANDPPCSRFRERERVRFASI